MAVEWNPPIVPAWLNRTATAKSRRDAGATYRLRIRKRQLVAHLQTHAPAFSRFAIAPAFIFRLENQRRNSVRLVIRVQRDKRDVRRAGVPPLPSQNILR